MTTDQEALFHEGEIRPLGDRLKVLPLTPRAMTRGGILMPEASEARDRPMEGLVLAVGRGRAIDSGMLVELECVVGDVVAFSKYAGIVVYDEAVGHDVLLMREDEALGRRAVAFTSHEAWPIAHVPGDPRCPICRAGTVDAAPAATR